MLTLFRRHLGSCPHGSRRYRRCSGPIHVEGSGADTLAVYRNVSVVGSITLAAPAVATVGATPVASAIGDFDFDSVPDLAIAKVTANTVSVLVNHPMQPFALPIGMTGHSYPATTFTQTGANVSLLSGTVPTGMGFSGPTLSGIPTQSGTSSFTMAASTAGGCSALHAYALVIRSAPVTFTDDPLIAGQTVIKAVHFTELRTAVNGLRTAASLGAFPFTDPNLSGLPVKSVHIMELRTALDQARAALGFTPLAYIHALTSQAAVIRAIDVSEIRTAATQ